MGENALCVRQCQELAAFFQKRTKKDFPAFRKRLSSSLREGVHPEQNVRSEGRSPAPPSAACPVLFPRHSLMTPSLCCATTPAHHPLRRRKRTRVFGRRKSPAPLPPPGRYGRHAAPGRLSLPGNAEQDPPRHEKTPRKHSTARHQSGRTGIFFASCAPADP